MQKGIRLMENRVISLKKAMKWIEKHTVNTEHGRAIIVSTEEPVAYPEVSGYYIPTLLQWGEREMAKDYAKYLCSIQKKDGSWYDCYDQEPYVFDSAQILKGLISIRGIMPEVDENIIKGCDWILTNMQPDGRLTTPSQSAWGTDDSICSELIHVYCLSPIKEAGIIFNKPEYIEAANKILGYYKREKIDKIKNFSLLSHFYAYVMEGLYDLGEIDLCRESMMNLEKYRNKLNGIPGLNDVPWVCSTGMFQLAVVWYKLGNLERGNSLFYYALSLQNRTGGWYGSYPAPTFWSIFYIGRKRPFYDAHSEISWANKYFLDALLLKEKLEFEKLAPGRSDLIDEDDGRYQLIRNLVRKEKNDGTRLQICNVGCGKGRYLKRLINDCPDNDYYATDISDDVMAAIDGLKNKEACSMTSINYEDNCFDFVYVCEALEHSMHIDGALNELCRITKPGCKIAIIDKPIEKLGQLEIGEWEQWMDDKHISEFVSKNDGKLEIVKSVPYEGKDDGLFRAWIITKTK